LTREALLAWSTLGEVEPLIGDLVDRSLVDSAGDVSSIRDPDRFDVQRRDVKHVGFGHGVHLCLGAELARLEATTVLQMLLQRYPELALESQVPAWGNSDFVRGLDELMVSV